MADPVAATLEKKIVQTGLKIKDAVHTALRNQQDCQEIGRRVLRCSCILSQLQQIGSLMDASPAATSGALEGLQETLERALQLVASCQEERSTIRRLVAARDLSKKLREVKDEIIKKMAMAVSAINVVQTTTILRKQIQAVGNPLHEGMGSGSSYRPYNSRSTSGTIVSSNYTNCTSSALSSVAMSTELLMLLGLDLDNDNEHAESRQEWRKETMKQTTVQEFFASPSANDCIHIGDMTASWPWFTDIGIVHVAGGAPVDCASSHAQNWILALDEIMETIRFTWPSFPDHGSLGLPGEEEEEEEAPELEASIPDKLQFALFIQKAVPTMLSFVDAIVASNAKNTIQKILLTDSGLLLLPYEEIVGTLLRVRAALSRASATLQLAFHYPPSEEAERILNEIASLLSAKEDKTGEAIWSTMEQVRLEFTEEVTTWSSSLAPQGSSEIYETTWYFMGYIRFLLSHCSSMEPIVSQAASLGRYVPRTRQDLLLSSLIVDMASCLQQGLAKISESFQDQSLRFLFLINNSNFITQQLHGTLPSLGDHYETAAVADKVEDYMESYMRVSWAPVLSCLHKPTPRLGRNYHPLSKFESEFHKIYTTQKLWKVPDPKLRKRLRRAITEKIIPDYTKHIEDNNVSAPKFTPQQLEEMLQELFEG